MSAIDPFEWECPILVPLAESSARRLAGLATAARVWLHARPDSESWCALAYELAKRAGNRIWPVRAVAIVYSRDELDAALEQLIRGRLDAGEVRRGVFTGAYLEPGTEHASGKQVFLIGGTGAQWPGMGRALAVYPAFRHAMKECDAAFAPHVDFSPFERMCAEGESARLEEIEIAAITTFSLCYSLDRLLRSWGVVPDAIAGHSMGEIVGAALAGGISLADAATVMVHWCRVQQHARPGQMLAIGLPAAEVRARLQASAMDAEQSLAVAAANSPRSTTVSGDTAAIAQLHDELATEGVRCRALRTGGAFHSALMAPLRAPLLAGIAAISPRRPACAFYSTVGDLDPATSAEAAVPLELGPEHWWRNLRQPVDLEGAVRRMARDGYRVFWELAPHHTLSTSIAECLDAEGVDAAVFGTLQRQGGAESMLAAAGRYFLGGGELRWAALQGSSAHHGSARAMDVALPEVEEVDLPGASVRGPSAAEALRAAEPTSRRQLILDAVANAASELLGAQAGELVRGGERSWIELGLESLHAVTLRSRLQRGLGLEVSLARFLAGESLSSFVAELERQVERMRSHHDRGAADRRAPGAARPHAERVRELAAREVDELLATLVSRCPPEELAALLRDVGAAS